MREKRDKRDNSPVGMRYPTQAKTRLEGHPTFSAAGSPLSPVGPPAMTNQRIERRPSVGSVWTVSALNPPIELSKINVSIAVSQLLWPDEGCEEWFSLGENHEKPLAFPDFLQRGTGPDQSCAAFFTESRIQFDGTTKLRRKSGFGLHQLRNRCSPEADHREAAPIMMRDKRTMLVTFGYHNVPWKLVRFILC